MEGQEKLSDWIEKIHQTPYLFGCTACICRKCLYWWSGRCLHSPSQGIAQPTKNPVKRYTKKQQEFLYDYYMERGKKREANEVYEE